MTKILDVSPTADNTTLTGDQVNQSVIGRMLALASSQDGQTVFAGSYSNMWVSGDNGQTWDQITWPQPAPGQFGVPGSMGGWLVVDIAVSPVDPHTVLAITQNDRERNDRGIWRSTDGGSNWLRVHQFPAGEAVGQLAWVPGSDHLVFAAGGSALAISKNGGATFQNVLPLGGGTFERINHVAVGLAPPSAAVPPVVYALGDNKMFVSFDGGTSWTKDLGLSDSMKVGGAVGTANSQAPAVMVISPRSPLEVFLVEDGSDADHVPALWRGDYTQFFGTHTSLWEPVPLPNLGGQDSGNVFLAASHFGHGNLLFYGGQRSKVYVGPLDPSSASDWVELDQDNQVHADLHGIFLSPDFRGTFENGNYQVSAGSVWLLSDGGIYRSVNGGIHFDRVKYVRSLSVVNVAGVAYEGLGPALSLNTGDNDGFYSMDGGNSWTSQEYGGGDNDCSYADPLAPNLMLVFTPRWDTSGSLSAASPDRGTITLYKSEQGGLPFAALSNTQRHIVPGPPRGTGQPAWNAGSTFGLRGSRPIVLTKPGETPAGDGDYAFIRFRTDETAVVLRTKSLLDIVSPDDWDTLSQDSASTAQMQIGGNTTQSRPFVTADGFVYFQGTNDNKLWKVFNDGSQQMQIGGNTTKSSPFVTADGWVYFQGIDNKLWKVFNDGSGQMQIGTNTTRSTPFVAPDGWVYFQGTDNKLWKVFNDGSGLTQIGTNTTKSSPFVTGDGFVYFQGVDDKLWKVFNDGSQQMQIGPNTTKSTPFVAPDGWVYFQGTDDTLWKVFNDGSGQMQIGGNTTQSAPFVVDGWVYFQGTNDDKLWRVFNNGSHQMQIGGNTTKSTPFATPDGWVYFQGTDDKLWKVFLPSERQLVFQQGPVLPSNDLGVLQASGGHTGTVFYAGGNSSQELWKWSEGMLAWQKLVPAPGGVAVARRFFVNPYLPNLIYLLDQKHVRRSEDGGHTWQVDASLERQLSGHARIPIERAETGDFLGVLLTDMQFDPYRPLTRFAVGEGGAFFTNDGVNWNRLLDTGASPGRPVNCYYDWISNPCERSLYVSFAGRSLVKISPLPWGALQSPDPALWSPPVMVSGLQTKSTPAVAVLQGVIYMVRNDGQSDALVWATSVDGLNWDPAPPLGEQSQTGASLAVLGALLHMVHLDSGSSNIRWSTFDGNGWTDNGPIAGVSSQTLPALVAFGGKLLMAFTDPATSQIRLLTFHNGAWDSNSLQNINGQLSTRPVKLAVFEQRIHLVYLQDSSNHICWSVSDGKVWWPRTRIRCRKGQSAPALAAHNGLLHMVHQGDGSTSTWWSLYDGDEWTPGVTIPDQDSLATVALCETPDQSRLTMLRRDASDNLWFSAV